MLSSCSLNESKAARSQAVQLLLFSSFLRDVLGGVDASERTRQLAYTTHTDHLILSLFPRITGWTRTIENTKEWLGDSEEYSDPRTRPAKVEVDSTTGDVRVDLGTLSNLFPSAPLLPEGVVPKPEAKILITTSPGKPPAPYTKEFLEDLQALFGGKGRADVVPRRSPKFELGRVARWARGRGYGAIAVVGEDHAKPSEFLCFSCC